MCHNPDYKYSFSDCFSDGCCDGVRLPGTITPVVPTRQRPNRRCAPCIAYQRCKLDNNFKICSWCPNMTEQFFSLYIGLCFKLNLLSWNTLLDKLCSLYWCEGQMRFTWSLRRSHVSYFTWLTCFPKTWYKPLLDCVSVMLKVQFLVYTSTCTFVCCFKNDILWHLFMELQEKCPCNTFMEQ